MKKFYSFILISLCVIIAGCSERTLEFDRKYPNTSKIDELRIKKTEELLKGKVGTEFSHLLGSNVAPDSIKATYLITMGENAEIKVPDGFNTNPLQYCWKKTVEECNHLTPINIHINTSPLESSGYRMSKAVLKPGERVSLNMFNIIDKTPLADNIELYILERDGSLTPHPISKLDKYNYAFDLPEDEKSYIFMIKAIFETHIGGIAYYPVNFNLR